VQPTFPTAASPSRTSLTLLLGLGADELSAILCTVGIGREFTMLCCQRQRWRRRVTRSISRHVYSYRAVINRRVHLCRIAAEGIERLRSGSKAQVQHECSRGLWEEILERRWLVGEFVRRLGPSTATVQTLQCINEETIEYHTVHLR
jgi:hypothetical protein